MARTKAGTQTDAPLTTAQQLGSLIKSARDIMRKDKGLNGDLDRLPMLTWIMFLKFLDDMEQMREQEAAAGGREVPPGHRAALPLAGLGRERDGITGDAHGVHQPGRSDAARRHQGAGAVRLSAGPAGGQRRRPAGCRSPRSSRAPSTGCSAATCCGMSSTRSTASTSRRRRKSTRSATSTSRCSRRCGTRPATPASSTRRGRWSVHGRRSSTRGWARRSWTRLRDGRVPGARRSSTWQKQCKTVEDREMLQEKSIFGGEAKPLPYLLAQMNLLLHGLEYPQIDPATACGSS